MAEARLQPASLYAHERGSVLVPLPLLQLPARVELLGEAWERKQEMHVTAVSTQALARRLASARAVPPASAQDAAWAAIAAAVGAHRAGTVTLRDELRLVRRGDERTLVAMAHVDGLADLHEQLAGDLGLELEPPPAHVTLYTRPGGEAIGLHNRADLERLSRPLAERPFPWPPQTAG